MLCYGCDGKGLVNLARLKSGEKFTDDTPTKVSKCLICKGKGKIDNGIVSKN